MSNIPVEVWSGASFQVGQDLFDKLIIFIGQGIHGGLVWLTSAQRWKRLSGLMLM